MSRKLAPASSLVGALWDLPGLGRVTVTVPTRSTGLAIDGEWSPHRPHHHTNRHWSWADILRDHPERLAIVTPEGTTVAVWSSGAHRLLRLPDGNFYRLDYIERDPRLGGTLPGAFAFALACARALELGADALVLASLPEVARFYEALGGEQRTARGWRPHRSLLPFVFAADTLRDLQEGADELRVEE